MKRANRWQGLVTVALMLAVTGCQTSGLHVQTGSIAIGESSPVEPSTVVSTFTSSASPSSGSTTPPTQTVQRTIGDAIVWMNDDGSGPISFGWTIDELHQRAAEQGWTYTPKTGLDDYGMININGGEDDPDGVSVAFVAGKLNALWPGNYVSTERGLVIGDSLDRMVQLYGTDYDGYDMDGTDFYDYTLASGIVLSINSSEGSGIVEGWVMGAPGSGR